MPLSNLCRNPLITHDFISCRTGIQLYWLGCEIRGIIGIQQLIVVLLRIALWQQERLAYIALVIDAGEIKTDIEAVTAAGCKDKPMGIPAPVVPAIDGTAQNITTATPKSSDSSGFQVFIIKFFMRLYFKFMFFPQRPWTI